MVMEKKRTNSGPFMESTSKHSIYPLPSYGFARYPRRLSEN
jgi:hypothetical protein